MIREEEKGEQRKVSAMEPKLVGARIIAGAGPANISGSGSIMRHSTVYVKLSLLNFRLKKYQPI